MYFSTVTENMQKVCISISPGIPLRGDILTKCYHRKSRSGNPELIWRCQFHTCAISDFGTVLSKQELDEAAIGECHLSCDMSRVYCPFKQLWSCKKCSYNHHLWSVLIIAPNSLVQIAVTFLRESILSSTLGVHYDGAHYKVTGPGGFSQMTLISSSNKA